MELSHKSLQASAVFITGLNRPYDPAIGAPGQVFAPKGAWAVLFDANNQLAKWQLLPHNPQRHSDKRNWRMQERLVDVLNDKNNVLHVFRVQIEAGNTPPQEGEFERGALEAAAAAGIDEPLKARLHVSRGGTLMPYGDVVQTKIEQTTREEERTRERAYFLWKEAGCPDNLADGFWQRACAFQCASTD